MSDFAMTFNALRAERLGTKRWILALGAMLLMAWMAWAVLARVTLYEVSSDARLELEGAAYPVASPEDGRVVATSLRVGLEVQRGDVLVELDSQAQQLKLQQAAAELEGIAPQIATLDQQIAAESFAAEHEAQSLALSVREAASRALEAQSPARFADLDFERMRKLHAQHLISTQDLDRSESVVARLHAAADASALAATRLPQERAARRHERDAELAQLEGQGAALEARRGTLRAERSRLAYEIEQRLIRAPADGQIGESTMLRIGAVLGAGDRLATVVPEGRLLVVAQYPASAAFGRIHAGQTATLRLEGFPWAEFGTVSARVQSVAREVRDGKVRIELALVGGSSFKGRLEHGMPGSLEVAVEHVSPAGLLLRAAGQGLSQHP